MMIFITFQSAQSDLLPLVLTVVVWVTVMALGVMSVLCWKRFRNLSFMEQFLDYRQVPTATEANETTQEIRNGHAEEVKETLDEETDKKGMWTIGQKAMLPSSIILRRHLRKQMSERFFENCVLLCHNSRRSPKTHYFFPQPPPTTFSATCTWFWLIDWTID